MIEKIDIKIEQSAGLIQYYMVVIWDIGHNRWYEYPRIFIDRDQAELEMGKILTQENNYPEGERSKVMLLSFYLPAKP